MTGLGPARSLGFSAKFTGSGGAFVLLWRGGERLTPQTYVVPGDVLADAAAQFRAAGFALVRARPRRPDQPLVW
jgi:hypothetical protein